MIDLKAAKAKLSEMDLIDSRYDGQWQQWMGPIAIADDGDVTVAYSMDYTGFIGFIGCIVEFEDFDITQDVIAARTPGGAFRTFQGFGEAIDWLEDQAQ